MDSYPKLHLISPEQLAIDRSKIIEYCTPTLHNKLTDCNRILQSCSNTEALIHLTKISTDSAFVTDVTPLPPVLAEQTKQEEYVAFLENYMGVIRVSGNPLSVLIQSIFQGYKQLLQEVQMAGTSLEAREWTHLRNSFESMLRYIALEDIARATDAPLYLPTAPSQSNNEYDPLRRWVLGHHIFYVVIQCFIVALQCFYTAIECDNLIEAETALALATALMWGSESALRFTGDFSVGQFQDVVRPSMMPPNAPPGLSGQFSGDHIYLVNFLARLKPLFANLKPCLRHQHDQFIQAFKAAYESHKFVCGQFVGNEGVSLRMNSKSPKTAVDVLEEVKNVRLKTVSSP